MRRLCPCETCRQHRREWEATWGGHREALACQADAAALMLLRSWNPLHWFAARKFARLAMETRQMEIADLVKLAPEYQSGR